MEGQSLIEQSRKYVEVALSVLPPAYTFHTFDHTKAVVRVAKVIGRACQLSAGQLDTLLLAAMFHDVGYCHGAKSHEERSASIAVSMLTKWGASNKLVNDVSGAILATKLPQRPGSIIDMVLCDADLAHLGSEQYELHASRLRSELEAQGYKFKSKRAWCYLNVEFLKSHHYFTDYGKTILESRKKVNLNKMIQQLHKQPIVKDIQMLSA